MSAANADASVSLALLHLAPRPGEVERNKGMIERAVIGAAAMGAKLIVCPELAVSGYGFRDAVGTGWIGRDQAALLVWADELARRASAFLLLGTPEAGPADGNLFNSVIPFAPDGSRQGHHRKINVLKAGSESWSVPGDRATTLTIDGLGRVGLFICADMHSRRLVEETASQGIDLMISSAAWAPGLHGPNGEWEWASRTAGRPVLVCNRTGVDVMDFSGARSVAAVDGSILFAHASPDPAVIVVEWHRQARGLSNWRVAAVP